MTTTPRMDMPAEGARPTLKWGRQVTETLAGSKISSPDHLIQETPGGTLIKHKTTMQRGSAAALPEATTLYMVMAVREFDADSNLVDIGSETDPLPQGHYYDWTADWLRIHE